MTEKSDPVEALRDLIKSYEALVLTARDRIIDLGGDCDPAARMIADDPALLEARSALAAAEAAGMVIKTEAELGADRREYYAAGMLDAARIVGTRAHLSEVQDAGDTVASILRNLESGIQQRAAMIEAASLAQQEKP